MINEESRVMAVHLGKKRDKCRISEDVGTESERMMSKCDDLEISGLTHGSGNDQSSHKEKQRFQQENLLGSGADVVFGSEYIEFKILVRHWASPMAQVLKNLPAMWETWV